MNISLSKKERASIWSALNSAHMSGLFRGNYEMANAAASAMDKMKLDK